MTRDELLRRIRALPRAKRLELYRALPVGGLAIVLLPDETRAAIAALVPEVPPIKGTVNG